MLSIPRPITPPDQFMKLSKWKFHHASSVIHCWRISDSQAFELPKQSNIIHSDNFLLHHAKLAGLQSQKLGVQLHPCSNIEPPLAIARNMIGCYHHNVACLSFCLWCRALWLNDYILQKKCLSKWIGSASLEHGVTIFNLDRHRPWALNFPNPKFPPLEIGIAMLIMAIPDNVLYRTS